MGPQRAHFPSFLFLSQQKGETTVKPSYEVRYQNGSKDEPCFPHPPRQPKDEHMVTTMQLKKIRGAIIKHSGKAPVSLKADPTRVYMSAQDAADNLRYIQRKARHATHTTPETHAATDSSASNLEA